MGFEFSYNKLEGARNILESKARSTTTPIESTANFVADVLPADTLKNIDVTDLNTDSIVSDHIAQLEKEDKVSDDKIFVRLLCPKTGTMSAIGAFYFYKHLAGKIFIAISMLMSMILLVGFKWIKSKKVNVSILLINIIAVSAFIVGCYIADVTMLYGVWVLLFLLLVQFQLERQRS